jgi:hypothetical protein
MSSTLINTAGERNVLHYTAEGRKTHSFAVDSRSVGSRAGSAPDSERPQAGNPISPPNIHLQHGPRRPNRGLRD